MCFWHETLFLIQKPLKKTLKNEVCSTPYIYTCVRPDDLRFSKKYIWWVYSVVLKPFLKIPSSFREIDFFPKNDFVENINRKIYMSKNQIFLGYIFFYLLIPLMGHHNALKKWYGVKSRGLVQVDPRRSGKFKKKTFLGKNQFLSNY